MANYHEFVAECDGELVDIINNGDVKGLLELWLGFLEVCENKAHSKLKSLDDLFGL